MNEVLLFRLFELNSGQFFHVFFGHSARVRTFRSRNKSVLAMFCSMWKNEKYAKWKIQLKLTPLAITGPFRRWKQVKWCESKQCEYLQMGQRIVIGRINTRIINASQLSFPKNLVWWIGFHLQLCNFQQRFNFASHRESLIIKPRKQNCRGSSFVPGEIHPTPQPA